MSKRKGTVSKIGKSKYSYFVQLDDDGHYFNTKYDPKCGVGDVVGITFEPKGEQRSQIKAIKVLTDNGGPKGYQDTGGGGYSTGGGSSGGGASGGRQDSIVYQSSRKDALVMVGLLLDQDTVKVPNGDKGRIVLEELVSEVTATFFKAASNPTEALKAQAGVDEDAGDDWSDDEPAKPAASGGDDWDDDDDWS
jgi:hypothetical protein